MNIDPSECRTCGDLANQLAAANARCAEHVRIDTAEKYRAKAEALQATLDRVTALADEAVYADFGQHHPHDGDDEEVVLAVREADLRAALTPEGKRDGCGVCLTCDPPQDDPRFGFPIMQRMYVCGTCGNKRCPASGDCLKWECSGSNATNQVPVLRTPEGTE